MTLHRREIWFARWARVTRTGKPTIFFHGGAWQASLTGRRMREDSLAFLWCNSGARYLHEATRRRLALELRKALAARSTDPDTETHAALREAHIANLRALRALEPDVDPSERERVARAAAESQRAWKALNDPGVA